MSLFKVFDVAGSAMNAQSVRMNVTASNLANAGSVSGDPELPTGFATSVAVRANNACSSSARSASGCDCPSKSGIQL